MQITLLFALLIAIWALIHSLNTRRFVERFIEDNKEMARGLFEDLWPMLKKWHEEENHFDNHLEEWHKEHLKLRRHIEERHNQPNPRS